MFFFACHKLRAPNTAGPVQMLATSVNTRLNTAFVFLLSRVGYATRVIQGPGSHHCHDYSDLIINLLSVTYITHLCHSFSLLCLYSLYMLTTLVFACFIVFFLLFYNAMYRWLFIMAALRSRCGHYIFALWFLLSSSCFLSSPNLSGRRLDVCPYFYTWCGPSANLECSSEMCCTRLAGNTGRKNDAKNRHLGTIAQLCRPKSSQLRHVSTIGKKLVKQQYILHMPPQYGELRPTSGWDRFMSLGTPANFNGFRVLAALLHATFVVGVSQTLRRWTQGSTYIRQSGHHVEHWPTF